MINESFYWKQHLRKHAEMLNEKLEQRVWRESSFAKVEQSVMLSCYIARKLAEAKKITDTTFQTPLTMRRFEATGETVDLLNNHKVDSLYHLGKGTDITKPFSYIANQLIHSFIFAPVFESPGNIHGFAFNSDRSKSRELYMIKLRIFIDAIAKCAGSYITRASYFRLENGELEVVLEDNL